MFCWVSFGRVSVSSDGFYLCCYSGFGEWVFFVLKIELGLLDGPFSFCDVEDYLVEESVDSKAEVIGPYPTAVIGVKVCGRSVEVENL